MTPGGQHTGAQAGHYYGPGMHAHSHTSQAQAARPTNSTTPNYATFPPEDQAKATSGKTFNQAGQTNGSNDQAAIDRRLS
jgi:hypothetical protein